MNAQEIEITVVPELAQIGQKDWDACACPGTRRGRPRDPFTTYRFLSALERADRSAPARAAAADLAARIAGQVIAVAPMYAKSHSQGEYIFDQNWAHAYERAGGRYYPKLQIAVPHTPATGRRFCAARV